MANYNKSYMKDGKETSPVDEIIPANEISPIHSIQENSEHSLMKYQWSPLNPENEKHYDQEFLIQMQTQPESLKKPPNLPNLDAIKKEIVRLKQSLNPWKPYSLKLDAEYDDEANDEMVYRKFLSILNKLTPEKFEILVKQAKKLEINTEERLKHVVDLVFDKAINEPKFSVPYANMCKQLALVKVPLCDQENFINFRKLLLTKCQKEFEKDRNEEFNKVEKLKEIKKATAEVKTKQLQEDLEKEEEKSRQRKLGNVRFIGELFKLGMLTELIMHECVKMLIFQGDEDSLTCLCVLLTIIGKELEIINGDPGKSSDEELHSKKSLMNEYIFHMQKIVDKHQTSSRVKFMLQDVIDLRKSSWVPKENGENPKTIDKIHKEAERETHDQWQLLPNMSFHIKRTFDLDRKKTTGILKRKFSTFYDNKKISWGKNDDQEGKCVAVNSVNSFFFLSNEREVYESADSEESVDSDNDDDWSTVCSDNWLDDW